MRDQPLGDMLTLDRHPVALEDDQLYETAGIYSYGRGLFGRPLVAGSDTSYSTYYELHCGQFVYSKLFAWEGALAVVNEHFAGMFVSQEFPTFTINPALAIPEYVALLCSWPETWSRVRMGETGLGGRRKRVHPDRLLEVELPFPSLAGQQRIVDLISTVDKVIRTAAGERATAKVALRVMREQLLLQGVDAPLEDLCSIEASLVDPTRQEYRDLPHVGIDRIESGTGRLLPSRTAAEDGVTSAKFLFTDKDVVLSKIRPNLRKATWPKYIGLASADAYPLRPKNGVDTSYLLEVLLSDGFVSQAVDRSGRTKMPKINRTELFSIIVPFMGLTEQRTAAARLSALRQVQDGAGSVEEQARSLRAALMSDLLTGAYELPESYDTLLETE